MFEIIMVFVVFTSAASMYASFQTAATPKDNVILNTTLPQEVLKDRQVMEIAKKYKGTNLLVFLVSLAAGLPSLLIPQPSFLILYLALWFVAALLAGNQMLKMYGRRLSKIKQQNEWFVGNTHTITVDLEVSAAKKSMPVSKFLFLPSLAATLAMLILGFASQTMTIYPGISALIGLLLYSFLYTVTAKKRARAYCEETEINMACNRVSIRLWTLCWTMLAGVQALSAAVFLFRPQPSTGLLMAVIGLGLFITLAAIFLIHSKIRTTQNLLMEGAKAPIQVDEDYYWRGGFYNNPNDNRTMVEKRIGYGHTLNLATKKGKLAYYSIVVGVPVILLAMFLTFLSFDTAKFELTVAANRVEINAPMYGYDFPVSDIKSITTIDTLPRGNRTNGAATSQYSLGNFRLNDYGKSKLYVYKDHPPYIVVELPDLYVFINAKTPEETQQYYELLLESIGE